MAIEEFDGLLDKFNADKGLVVTFFVVFSRFEATMKAMGHMKGKDGDPAEPDWENFAKVYRDYFKSDLTEELKKAVTYIETKPPKQQVRKGKNELTWAENRHPANMPQLLRLTLYVRRVRNNLFHGGKFAGGIDATPERNTELLHHSLVLLDEFIRLGTAHGAPFQAHFFGY